MKPAVWLTVLCGAFALLAAAATADQLYRWVDPDGKVHYSQTPPPEGSADRIDTRDAPRNDAAPPPSRRGRDKDGNCVTMKCLADQAEADRLKREREYARQQEQEKAAERNKPDPRIDDRLRENCRNAGASMKVNCNDIEKLRKQWRGY